MAKFWQLSILISLRYILISRIWAFKGIGRKCASLAIEMVLQLSWNCCNWQFRMGKNQYTPLFTRLRRLASTDWRRNGRRLPCMCDIITWMVAVPVVVVFYVCCCCCILLLLSVTIVGSVRCFSRFAILKRRNAAHTYHTWWAAEKNRGRRSVSGNVTSKVINEIVSLFKMLPAILFLINIFVFLVMTAMSCVFVCVCVLLSICDI